MSSSNIRLRLSHQKIMKICNVYVLGDHMYLMMLFANSPKNSFLSIKCLVEFFNDPAVDGGGPRREFFHLLLHGIFNSSLFSGYPSNVVPVHNIKADLHIMLLAR